MEQQSFSASSTGPLISVILPIYNAEQYLDQALKSIEGQSYDNLEIICLNDGSSDSSLEIIMNHASVDERIVVIDKDNQGYGATCNIGIDKSNGSWISIVEPDDWIEARMFETMVNAMSGTMERPVDIIKTPYWRIVNPDTPEELKLNCSYKGRIKPSSTPFTIEQAPHLLSHHPSIWSAIYRRKFLEKHCIRFREYKGAGWADNPFLIETLCQADAIVYIDEPFYCYREETLEKTASFHRSNPLLPIERWLEMQSVLKRLGVSNEPILRAHIERGFTYLNGVLNYVEIDSNPELRRAIESMFAQMDVSIVLNDPRISPAAKKMFRDFLGLPEGRNSTMPYIGFLIQEGLYNFSNIGIRNTFMRVKRYLHHD